MKTPGPAIFADLFRKSPEAGQAATAAAGGASPTKRSASPPAWTPAAKRPKEGDLAAVVLYLVKFAVSCGKMDNARATKLGVPAGPDRKLLKMGQSVSTAFRKSSYCHRPLPVLFADLSIPPRTHPGTLFVCMCVLKALCHSLFISQITLANGTVVHPSDVLEPSETQPQVLIVDCPSLEFLDPIAAHPRVTPLYG